MMLAQSAMRYLLTTVMVMEATEDHAGGPLVKLGAIGDPLNSGGAQITGTSRCGAISGSNAALTVPAFGSAMVGETRLEHAG